MRTVCAIVAFAMSAGWAAAAETFPGGSFGEREGCHYAKTGESSGADGFLLLNKDGITTSVSFCALRKATAKSKTRHSLVVACESEGESGGEETGQAVFKSDAWTVKLEDGTHWGPMQRCR